MEDRGELRGNQFDREPFVSERVYFNSNRAPSSNDSEHRPVCAHCVPPTTYLPCTSDKVIQSEESCFQSKQTATDYAVPGGRENPPRVRESACIVYGRKGFPSPAGTRDYSYYCNKDTRFVCSRTRGKRYSTDGQERRTARFIRPACGNTSAIKCLHTSKRFPAFPNTVRLPVISSLGSSFFRRRDNEIDTISIPRRLLLRRAT